jgi:hypothetical protein
MSTTSLHGGRPPRTDAEWARDTQRRLDKAENPTAVRIGEWVLSTTELGVLIASHVDGGSIVLARPPAAEQDPDALVTTGSVLKVAVTANSSSSPIIWNAIVFASSDWAVASPPGQEFRIPGPGVYEITATIVQTSNVSGDRSAWVMIDGVRVMQDIRSWGSITAVFPAATIVLTQAFSFAGDEIISVGTNVNYGMASGQTGVQTTLSIIKVGDLA